MLNLSLLCVWLWINCGGAMWAHLSSGGKKRLCPFDWILIVLAPVACTMAVFVWMVTRVVIGKEGKR